MLNNATENLETEQAELPIDEHGNTPPFIVEMLHNPPILPNESKEEFFEIYQSYEMMEEGDAFTPAEYMLAFRATVLTFELIRYERMKIAILRNQHRPATESLFRRTGGIFSAGRGSEAIASTGADKYYTDTAYKKKSDQKFAAAGYAPDAVDGEAFLRSLPSLASIERLIASAEKRLFNFIKAHEARYSARAAQIKATATKVIENATKSPTPASE
jgi:hypothetical protein